jgi:hypothetical protein
MASASDLELAARAASDSGSPKAATVTVPRWLAVLVALTLALAAVALALAVWTITRLDTTNRCGACVFESRRSRALTHRLFGRSNTRSTQSQLDTAVAALRANASAADSAQTALANRLAAVETGLGAARDTTATGILFAEVGTSFSTNTAFVPNNLSGPGLASNGVMGRWSWTGSRLVVQLDPCTFVRTQTPSPGYLNTLAFYIDAHWLTSPVDTVPAAVSQSCAVFVRSSLPVPTTTGYLVYLVSSQRSALDMNFDDVVPFVDPVVLHVAFSCAVKACPASNSTC